MSNLNTILKNFGMSEKESRIYLTLLELGKAKVNEIAKYSKINRSSTYVVLEMLKKRGLVGLSNDKNIQHYVASSPETLLQVARAKAVKHQNVKEDIESVIPELKALSKNTKHRPVVQVFEGKEGLINIFEDSLKCKEKIMRVASSVGNIAKLLPKYFPDYIHRRINKKIKMYGIHPDDQIAKKLIKITNNTKLDTPMLIPKNKYNIPADIALYDDKIGYMTPSNGGVAILIQNKELVEVMKNIFDLAWEEAKRINKATR